MKKLCFSFVPHCVSVVSLCWMQCNCTGRGIVDEHVAALPIGDALEGLEFARARLDIRRDITVMMNGDLRQLHEPQA